MEQQCRSRLQRTNSRKVSTASVKFKKTLRTGELSALKSKNKSLVSALDDARQDVTKLQGENLGLKRERQYLLEKIVSLENQLGEIYSDYQSLIYFITKAQKNLAGANSLLMNRKCRPHAPNVSCISPVGQHMTDSSSMPELAHYQGQIACATQCGSVQLSSTPLTYHQTGKNGMEMDQLEVMEMDKHVDTTPITSDGGWLPPSSSPPIPPCISTGLSMGSLTGGNKSSNESGLCSLESDTISTQSFTENQLRRPKRSCTLMVSYEEPTLNSKLRRGDRFTDISGTCWTPQRFKKVKARRPMKQKFTTTKPKGLQDITNRK